MVAAAAVVSFAFLLFDRWHICNRRSVILCHSQVMTAENARNPNNFAALNRHLDRNRARSHCAETVAPNDRNDAMVLDAHPFDLDYLNCPNTGASIMLTLAVPYLVYYWNRYACAIAHDDC